MKLASTGFALVALAVCWLPGMEALSNVPDQYFGGSNLEGYLNWVDEKGGTYKASTFMEVESTNMADQGAAVHWRVKGGKLHIAVAARATGWLALGLSEAGGMAGADMAIYESSKPFALTDAYVLQDRAPRKDDCQDWTLVDVHKEGGFLIWEGSRKLDTEDTQDRKIMDDSDPNIASQRLIAAWGDTDTYGYHGQNRVRGAIRVYGSGSDADEFAQKMKENSDGYFDLLVDNWEIEPIDTVYKPFCFTWSDLADQGVPQSGSISVVGMQIVLDEIGKPFVHHATLKTGDFVTESRTCGDNYFGFLYSYTPGALPYATPPGTGFTIGPGDKGRGTQSFSLEIHYNNPELLTGFIDNGGIRVYYSSVPVEHELGLLPVGDLFTNLRGQLVSFGQEAVAEYGYDCPGECTTYALDDGKPITVIGEYFHMHSIGKAMYNQQIRNGEVIRTGGIDFWDFDQAGVLAGRQPAFEVQAGDAFHTECFFDGTKTTVFGDASSQEMCQAYLLYYPKKELIPGVAPWLCTLDFPLPACDAKLTTNELNDDVPRVFGLDPLRCSAGDDTAGKFEDTRDTNGQDPDYSGSSTIGLPAGSLIVLTTIVLSLLL